MYDVINMPDLIVRYFSSTPWLVIFLISTIYLFFRQNTAGKRAMLAAVIGFFLVINAFVIKLFTSLGEDATFYRHLWAIPSIVIVGIAVIDFIRIIPRWFLRVPAVLALAIILWFVNEHEYIRCRTQTFSSDAKMVPEDVIEIGDNLETVWKESGKNYLFIVCPIAYERSYGNMSTELRLYSGFLQVSESSVITDENHNGEAELMGENPDVDYILSTCCSKGVDYVITSNNESLFSIFYTRGFSPQVVTENYLVFKCQGFPGYETDFTRERKTSWTRRYDEEGNTTYNEEGYSRTEYEYGRYNEKTYRKIYYEDIEGNLVENIYGFAQGEWVYSKNGLVEMHLYDVDGNPCIRANHGFSTIRYTRDDVGRVTSVSYFDVNDKPFQNAYDNNSAIIKYEYDEAGNMVSEQYYDKNDEPNQNQFGYDEVRREYDESNRMTRESYYTNDNLINRTDTGYAEKIFVYDEAGNLVQEIYHDQSENVVDLNM